MDEEPGDNLIQHLFGPRARLLIVRGGRLGDFLATTPAFRALRQALPAATIGLITSPGLVPLARRYRWFDDVFAAPGWPGVSDGPTSEEVRRAFVQRMQDWHADVAIQLNGGGENSNPLVLQLGARFTVGGRHPAAPDLDLTVPYVRDQPVRFQLLDVVAALGIPTDSMRLELPAQPTDDGELAAALPPDLSLAELEEQPLLGIHPGSRSGARQWPIERYAAVAVSVWEEHRLRPVVLGDEQHLGRALVQRIGDAARPIDLTGRTSLGALSALIRRLTIFVGNDSGPAHVAEAVGTPSVVIFGSSNPLSWGPPDQRLHRVVASWNAPCRWAGPCGCPDDSSVPCLQAVEVAAVLAEISSLLSHLQRTACLRRLADHPTARSE